MRVFEKAEDQCAPGAASPVCWTYEDAPNPATMVALHPLFPIETAHPNKRRPVERTQDEILVAAGSQFRGKVRDGRQSMLIGRFRKRLRHRFQSLQPELPRRFGILFRESANVYFVQMNSLQADRESQKPVDLTSLGHAC